MSRHPKLVKRKTEPENTPAFGTLEVWHIPQVPMKGFRVRVSSPEEAKKIIKVLWNYDIFQYENNIKPDYANASGLEVYLEDSDGDGNPGWNEWEDDEGSTITDLIREEKQ